MKVVVLSFDVEEFDMPYEYGGDLNLKNQIEISSKGLDSITKLLDENNIKATFYCTGVFAQNKSEKIKDLSVNHEIASHNFYHSSHKNEDLLSSRSFLQNITDQKIAGFRMPRLAKVDNAILEEAGYQYNSSINPTWLPGRYNNLNISRKVFVQNNLIQFPVSVSPKFRIPLFWIAFHVLPLWMYLYLIKQNLRSDGYVHFYFHPWEFTDYHLEQNGAKYPFYLKKNNGKKMTERFEKLIKFLQKEGCVFQTTSEFLALK
ncbi:MAG: polysaccharide deacetylase family protein [Pseudarcicella sp.]|nr:polysaccharide deacetylase family protein [Pseudarcicella sp.]MBP6410635.1 polysaccharide deacetylase family protein [Pseudarcicella sp.]